MEAKIIHTALAEAAKENREKAEHAANWGPAHMADYFRGRADAYETSENMVAKLLPVEAA